MAHGLQIWNSSGDLALTVTDSLTRWVATYTGTLTGHYDNYPAPSFPGGFPYIATVTQNISVPGIVNDGTWGITIQPTYFKVLTAWGWGYSGPWTQIPLDNYYMSPLTLDELGSYPACLNAFFRGIEAAITTNTVTLTWQPAIYLFEYAPQVGAGFPGKHVVTIDYIFHVWRY